MARINSDIDIDMADRSKILAHIPYVSAAMYNTDPLRRHATGVYVTPIPYNPVHNMAAIDYQEAEQRGYFKLDLLNVNLYSQVRDEEHLYKLMMEPNWARLAEREFVEELIHVSNYYEVMQQMPESINSVTRMAMFLAIIRPAKRHLIGRTWAEVAQTVWEKDFDKYTFKKSHSIAYAQLVVVNMNLLEEQGV
jgi:hypothetical protein